jgi:hypothetical protein
MTGFTRGARSDIGHFLPVCALLACTNRGAGALREVAKRDEQPLTAISPIVGAGALPEIAAEDLVRAADERLGPDGKSLSDTP